MGDGLEINYLDVLYVMLILGFAGRGYRKGLFFELIGFVGIFFAVAISLRSLGYGTPFIGDLFNMDAGKSALLVFTAVFIFILIVLRYGAIIVRRHADLRLTDAINKALGGVLGLVKGGVIASLLAIVLTLYQPTALVESQVKASSLHVPVAGIAPRVYDQVRRFMPGEKRFVNYLQGVVPQFKSEYVDDAFLNLILNLGPDDSRWPEKAKK